MKRLINKVKNVAYKVERLHELGLLTPIILNILGVLIVIVIIYMMVLSVILVSY